jgi:hypothetical protein
MRLGLPELPRRQRIVEMLDDRGGTALRRLPTIQRDVQAAIVSTVPGMLLSTSLQTGRCTANPYRRGN